MPQARHRGGLLDRPAGSRLKYSTRKSSAADSAERGWSRQAACWPTPSLAHSPASPSRCRQGPVSPSASITSFRPPHDSASRKHRHLLFYRPHQPTCRYIHRRFRPLSFTTEGTANFLFNEGTPLSGCGCPVRLLSPTRYPLLRSCSKLPLAVYKLHGMRKIAASAIPSQRKRWSPNKATTPWLS